MEPIRQAAVIAIDDPTQVFVARRAALDAGRRSGFPEPALAHLEIVAVELANNILQHAEAPGRILVASDLSGTAVLIVAVDSGRGIADIERSLKDGFSTRGTPGTGLGAVRRLSSTFDIYSVPGQGTVVSALLLSSQAAAESPHAPEPPSQDAPAPIGAVLCTAIQGEVVSGDSWAFAATPAHDLYLLIDGLGHGLQASEAALLGVDIFRRSTHLAPSAIIAALHAGMRATRGAAAAVLAVDHSQRQIICCGVGNISCLLQAPDGRTQSLVSHNGTVGHQMRRVQEFPYTFVPGSLLVLHSDGLASHWKLSGYPGLSDHHPATVAGVLYRDAARQRDDVTVLVSRLHGQLGSHADLSSPVFRSEDLLA